jgi:outer membrane translocation and assembly module TamA
MRGYGRHELGPRDADGNPLGGQVRLLAGAELRAMVRPPLGLAWFVDTGQVWARRTDVDLADLAVASGLGLLVETPVGPLRLDLAYNLTPPAHDDVGRWKLQFAIGHPY